MPHEEPAFFYMIVSVIIVAALLFLWVSLLVVRDWIRDVHKRKQVKDALTAGDDRLAEILKREEDNFSPNPKPKTTDLEGD